MKTNRRTIAIGACVVLGIGMALPAVGAAAGGSIVSLAQNALKVQGYGVSKAPKANTLIPLNGAAKLPPGVLPDTVLTRGDLTRPGSRANKVITADDSGKVPFKVLPDNVARTDGIKDGQTVTGTVGSEASVWANTTVVNYGAAASFPAPLAIGPDNVHMGIVGGNIEDPACTGTFEEPTAPAGHLCIYPGVVANGAADPNIYSDLESEVANITLNGDQAYNVNAYPLTGAAGVYGFRLDIQGKCAAASTTNTGPGQATISDSAPCTTKFFATWAYTAGVAVDESGD